MRRAEEEPVLFGLLESSQLMFKQTDDFMADPGDGKTILEPALCTCGSLNERNPCASKSPIA
jgi:hypothetical protein